MDWIACRKPKYYKVRFTDGSVCYYSTDRTIDRFVSFLCLGSSVGISLIQRMSRVPLSCELIRVQ